MRFARCCVMDPRRLISTQRCSWRRWLRNSDVTYNDYLWRRYGMLTPTLHIRAPANLGLVSHVYDACVSMSKYNSKARPEKHEPCTPWQRKSHVQATRNNTRRTGSTERVALRVDVPSFLLHRSGPYQFAYMADSTRLCCAYLDSHRLRPRHLHSRSR